MQNTCCFNTKREIYKIHAIEWKFNRKLHLKRSEQERDENRPPQHKCCCSHAFNNGFLVLRSAIESASKRWARADSIWRHWSAVSSEQCFLSPRGSCSGGIYEDRHADNLILSLFINPCVSPSEIMLGHPSLGHVIFLVCCMQHYVIWQKLLVTKCFVCLS